MIFTFQIDHSKNGWKNTKVKLFMAASWEGRKVANQYCTGSYATFSLNSIFCTG